MYTDFIIEIEKEDFKKALLDKGYEFSEENTEKIMNLIINNINNIANSILKNAIDLLGKDLTTEKSL